MAGEITLHLTGRIPSKKNSKQLIRTKAGRPFVVSSKEHKEWHHEALWIIHSQKKNLGIEQCEVSIFFRFPDKRKTDLSNKAESVMDLLVDAGVLTDDSWHVVNPLRLYGEYDKENPGAKIVITVHNRS